MIEKLLILTPVKHIPRVFERLSTLSYDIIYQPDTEVDQLVEDNQVKIIFTNPNKLKFRLDKKVLERFPMLEMIVTASTGTVHIDATYCDNKNIKIISIKNERAVLDTISATAELAFLKTLAACRNYVKCVNDARNSENWDYEPYIGRQVSSQKIGVVGYGRLGTMYSAYACAMGADVYIFEKNPTVKVPQEFSKLHKIDHLFETCSIISLHVHSHGNENIINSTLLDSAKDNLILINTSRGEIVDEDAMVEFLNHNPKAIYGTDVIASENSERKSSPLYSKLLRPNQLLLSQHIGGMCVESQETAYNRAIDLLELQLHDAF